MLVHRSAWSAVPDFAGIRDGGAAGPTETPTPPSFVRHLAETVARRASISQSKFGRTSAPRWSQPRQTNFGSMSDSRPPVTADRGPMVATEVGAKDEENANAALPRAVRQPQPKLTPACGFGEVFTNERRSLSQLGASLLCALRELAEPDPSLRGHPQNKSGQNDRLSVQQYISLFNSLRRRSLH